MNDEPEPRWDGMRRVPCLLCNWAYAYDPILPGRREFALKQGLKHYEMDHGGDRGNH